MPTCCLLSLFELSWSQLLLLHWTLLMYPLLTPLTETLLLLLMLSLLLLELKKLYMKTKMSYHVCLCLYL